MSKTENQRRILTKCPFLAHSEKFPRDLAKVQKKSVMLVVDVCDKINVAPARIFSIGLGVKEI